MDPWSDPKGFGWQIIQSLYAIGSGGLFGVGLGNSMQKIPIHIRTIMTFIFAVVAEELGFIGCAVILLFGILIWRENTIAIRAKDMFWNISRSRNNITLYNTSSNKHRSCNISISSNRNGITIFLVMEVHHYLCSCVQWEFC